MNFEAILWFVLLVVFIMAEASTVTMVAVWFMIGSLVALIVSLLSGPFWLQILLFLAVSAVLLILLRPVARKYFTPRLTKTNVDAVVGTKGRVTVAIDNVESRGRVKLGNMEWSARSTTGQPIEKDALVVADRVEGVKVFVTPTN